MSIERVEKAREKFCSILHLVGFGHDGHELTFVVNFPFSPFECLLTYFMCMHNRIDANERNSNEEKTEK